jgi:phospholipid N-methyltransferase
VIRIARRYAARRDGAAVTRRRPLRDSMHFFGSFLRRPGSIGAVLPSSVILARALAGDLDLAPGDLVVEFGPGTGPMTRVIADQLDGARYLGIERDASFCRLLSERFPRLAFHFGSVEDVAAILSARGLGQPNVIVSGLPFASLPRAVQERVIDGIAAVLAPGGEFRTFQYVHAYPLATARRFRAMMAARFPRFERSRPVLRNVPPAYVLTYRR